MLYTVGEMSKVLGVPASTLRYYDKKGLLPFVERSRGGIRMFSDKDYGWLKVIECLKHSGLTLREIKSFIDMAERGDESLTERRELFQSRRDAVAKQMEEMQETLELLAFKCWYYEQAIKEGTEQKVKSRPLEEIPEQYRTVKRKMDIIHSNDSE